MQAILTKYLGPTNVRGSRIKATARAGSVTASYDHALDADGNHKAAAAALCAKMGWTGDSHKGSWVMGFLPNGDMAHVWHYTYEN